MTGRTIAWLLIATFVFPLAAAAEPFAPADRQAVRDQAAAIDARLAGLVAGGKVSADLAADARIFTVAAVRAVDFEPEIDGKTAERIKAVLARAAERATLLEQGGQRWMTRRGRGILGFVSAVDGSTQPFGLVLPEGYDPTVPMRLDVVLHGSMRATGAGMLAFIEGFDRGDASPHGPVAAPFIELHPLGRLGENAYRFEGETDVDEAIAAVCRRFAIDRQRIVLRGSSLGGVGTWQLGLKRPDRYAALGPACGPVDTHVFAASPWKHFVRLDPLTPWQHTLLHMVDAIDYTANAAMVPTVAVMGSEDPYISSHTLMEQAFAREGIAFNGIVARGEGHGLSAATMAKQLELLAGPAAAGIPARPPRVRFVTWSLKFSRCHWLEVLGLERHYSRAEFDGTLAADGSVAISKLEGITRFALHPPAVDGPQARVTILGTPVSLPARPAGDGPPSPLVFERRDGRWTCLGPREAVTLTGKRPGLQGPIDDAFATRFLCVRGTGTPWNDAAGHWAEASLRRFAWEWRRHSLGDLPVKDDTDVTPEDLRESNLVLFGDPGSNRLIREALPGLPLTWTRQTVAVGGVERPAGDHAVQLIAPSPLPGAAGRYVVLNSGHTYHDPELRFSYMVFPRLGDWALVRCGDNPPLDPTTPIAPAPAANGTVPMKTVAETLVTSGFFDEDWK
jgi:poly(3-hydroxybutyrate) depolymerase